MAHIIVFGNEKGGSGKSTTCMHTATALVRSGLRIEYGARHDTTLPTPVVMGLPKVDRTDLAEGENPFDKSLGLAVAELEETCDFIVIDCPGSHTRLSQVAHSLADTLVTPLNDSFVDFDLLARVDADTGKIIGPSVYSEMVWHARQLRAKAGLKPIDWIVLRNRLGAQEMHNKRKMGQALEDLSKRIGFRVAPGFTERVIFRELFPRGMTLLDLKDIGIANLNLSNIAARQEVRDLIRALNLPDVDVAI